MNERTSPQIFSELSDLIKELERASLGIGRLLAHIESEDLTQERIKSIVEKLTYVGGLVQPLRTVSKELFIKSITDGLTKLKNRGYFEEVIKKEMEGIKDVSCIMVDIDHFGKYNNTYGHQQGDKALQTTAQIIGESAETEFIARYGGEEFSIILTGYSNSNGDIHRTTERIRRNVESAVVKPFSVEVMGVEKLESYLAGVPLTELITERAADFLRNEKIYSEDYQDFLRDSFMLHAFTEQLDDTNVDRRKFSRNLQKVRKYLVGMQKITVSVGAAMRKPGEDIESLIYHADEALYIAKQKGRNRVYIG